ncbi:MAG TPA: SOS response-associated peptidase [Pyrinomonadaceae bacterium]|nr:SOS response-associated peptidase [Pyrinomonadaceae bacterium]
MCGRYAMAADYDRLRKKFPLFADQYWDEFFDIHGYSARPEIFPGTKILALNGHYHPEYVHWTIRAETWNGKIANAINAKAETIQKVQMFRDAFRTDRVLIPATSLFEWQEQPDGSKKKFRIWFDEPIFTFAGIARTCTIKGEEIRCTAIITTRPNETFALIHNTKQRQAVVIREEDHEKWLDPATKPDMLNQLMEPLSAESTHFEEASAERGKDNGLFDANDGSGN